MSITCDPSGVQNQARAFNGYGVETLAQIKTLLLAQLAGGSTDPIVLAQAAKCIKCDDPATLMEVEASLWCVLTGGTIPAGGGGGGGGGGATCPDVDANNFLTTAGISDATTVNAVCALVGSLKSAGLWTIMDAIYPFVGGTSVSNSYNLKNPAAFRIAWTGGMTFSSNGITSDGATAYGDTGLVPSTAGGNYTLNSASMGMCIKAGSITTTGMAMASNPSGNNNPVTRIQLQSGSSPGMSYAINDANTIGDSINGSANGLNVASRTNSTTEIAYSGDGTNVTVNENSTSLPSRSIFLMADNQLPVTVTNFFGGTATLAFIGGGLTGAQIVAFQAASNTFQAALGRT